MSRAALRTTWARTVSSWTYSSPLTDTSSSSTTRRWIVRRRAEGLSVRNVEEIVALGEEQRPRARKPRAGAYHPQLDRQAARLSDRFDTRVRINLGQRKGKLTFEFASVEDLDRIVALMGGDPAGDTGAGHVVVGEASA